MITNAFLKAVEPQIKSYATLVAASQVSLLRGQEKQAQCYQKQADFQLRITCNILWRLSHAAGPEICEKILRK